jgi:hypothetical protein
VYDHHTVSLNGGAIRTSALGSEIEIRVRAITEGFVLRGSTATERGVAVLYYLLTARILNPERAVEQEWTSGGWSYS